MAKYLVTGDAGFIGFHVSKALLERGHTVLGIDALTDYYDPRLKQARLSHLLPHSEFTHVTAHLEDADAIRTAVGQFRPEIVIHLAAQAGVRYSIDHPRVYLDSNILGSQTLLECVREVEPSHVLLASTSSVYGGNTQVPFDELDRVQSPVSLYAATKLAMEALAHSHSHLWGTPVTCFRFFTVYGPWGRPDMALFKFVGAIEAGEAIDVYGFGKMRRDFTYIDDLVAAVLELAVRPPTVGEPVSVEDSLSPVAPYRVVNLAGGAPVELMEFVRAVEVALGKLAEKRMLPMQPGDVVATHAAPELLRDLIGTIPSTPVGVGVQRFVDWYREYHGTAVEASEAV